MTARDRSRRRWLTGPGLDRVARAGWLALCVACGPRGLPPPPPASTAPPIAPPAAPEDARARYLEAAVAQRRGDVDRAEEALRWVVRLDRTDPWAWIHLGAFLERQLRTSEALDAYREALDRDPDLPAANLALGTALVRAGDPAAALPFLERATIDSDARALHLYARALELTGDLTRATAVLERWLAQPVTSSEAIERARLAYEFGHFDAAVDDLVKRVTWTTAPTPAAVLLLEAATRACRIGTAWLWVREEGIASHPDPRWRRIAATIDERAVTPPVFCDAYVLPETPTCDDLATARAAWEVDPLADATLDALDRAARSCRSPEASALVARIRFLREAE